MRFDDLQHLGEDLGAAGDNVAGFKVVVRAGKSPTRPPASVTSKLPAAASQGLSRFPAKVARPQAT